MSRTIKWLVGGVTAVMLGALVYAAPVWASGVPFMGNGGFAGMMNGNMAGVHQSMMSGDMAGMHESMMSGDMAGMHESMMSGDWAANHEECQKQFETPKEAK